MLRLTSLFCVFLLQQTCQLLNISLLYLAMGKDKQLTILRHSNMQVGMRDQKLNVLLMHGPA